MAVVLRRRTTTAGLFSKPSAMDSKLSDDVLVQDHLAQRNKEGDEQSRAIARDAASALRRLGLDPQDALGLSSKAFQEKCGAILRQKLIEYLISGDGPVACGFRREFNGSVASGLGVSMSAYLNKLERNAMMSGIEVQALAEMAGVNAIVKDKDSRYCLYATSEDAVSVTLINEGNVHFTTEDAADDISGNGNNCLAHSLLASLRQQHRTDMGVSDNFSQFAAIGAVVPGADVVSDEKLGTRPEDAVEYQVRIEDHNAKANKELVRERLQRDQDRAEDAKTHEQVMARHQQEDGTKADAERAQINGDHQAALYLAGLFSQGKDLSAEEDLYHAAGISSPK